MPSRIDLHVHSTIGSPDSEIAPAGLVKQAKEAGLSGVVITEHFAPWSKEASYMNKEIAMIMPIEAGKTDAWIQTHKELMGPRYEGYAASKQRFGIESQVSFLQKTPMGDFEVLYMKGSDIKEVFENNSLHVQYPRIK